MAGLTTHVLDLTLGTPAEGLVLRLYRWTENRELIKEVSTNADGRTSAPLLSEDELSLGTYELEFDVLEYHNAAGITGGFLTLVPIRFTVTDLSRHYHVPLLLSAFGYSTYRGS
ncbi:hydroxyisourate hydrolase [Deinococcus cellulosilyticus]|uniref:5-hydroxyisourate hydrolase n=1 Tax=Deinococcus cellulosilyticus (strain DSM 18568 / NBRC 106333 / KACC 11606 / 5516J-15) TaxID=1223518 RepID=A0A511NB93_DEIC1|nr:hydroxyisourate hydrolase [Deinococcus cellulosilyticus]GEM50085.1 5-hydroxyisourate hydrolase [Deinococcus cellulosilyticus NBRC 106333 = KACC 11606]